MSDPTEPCLVCRWYGPNPLHNGTGVCFAKWVDTTVVDIPNGAYERTFQWMTCKQWTPQPWEQVEGLPEIYPTERWLDE